MKKLKIGITSLASAVTAFYVAKKMKEASQEPKYATVPKRLDNFEWIDAYESTEEVVYETEEDDEDDGPLFSIGEMVVTFSPYTDDFVDYDFDGSPLYFEIEDYKWDEEDRCYRYLLEGDGEWYGEDWLAKPEFPFMTKGNVKDAPETKENKREESIMQKGHRASEKAEIARRKEWARRADELLDLYNEHVKEDNLEEAEKVMKTYRYEQAMFDAGTEIRKAGGELNGIRPVLQPKESDLR